MEDNGRERHGRSPGEQWRESGTGAALTGMVTLLYFLAYLRFLFLAFSPFLFFAVNTTWQMEADGYTWRHWSVNSRDDRAGAAGTRVLGRC